MKQNKNEFEGESKRMIDALCHKARARALMAKARRYVKVNTPSDDKSTAAILAFARWLGNT